jgi:DNA-binding transcriptional MerR regulator
VSTQPVMTQGLSVSALANRVGVGADTIRYYEKAGLLPVPERTAADYRSYDDSAVDRLRFIQGGQRLGLRRREIKTLLEVRDTGQCPCEPAEQLLRTHVAEIDRELARLRSLRRELVAMADRLPSRDCPDPTPGTWRPKTSTGEVIVDECTELDLPVLRGPML